MRTVLIPHQTNGNIYIRELGRAYAALGWQPIYGPENLLERNVRPDLLHLHWPEEFYRWRGEGAPAARAQHFLDSIRQLRAAGVPVAWTIHNLAPHDHQEGRIDAEVYHWIAQHADCIHHHCANSRQLLAARYAGPLSVRQIVVPHGHYFAYPNTVTREEARLRLGIAANARVFLQFGQIRGYKGLRLLLEAFDLLRLERKFLLVAGQYTAPTGSGALKERLSLAWRKRRTRDFLLHGRTIDSERIQDYLNAADCMVLSHTAGLNSGVAVLGMSFGKPMIGPELGCLDWVLRQGPNRTYPAGDARALAQAMQHVFDDPAWLTAAAHANRLAATRWQWEDIAGQVLSQLELAS